nr:uncharacterized protein LOC127347836 [Lolium perenne]
MDMESLPTGIGSPANRRRRARVEDPVAKHGPFFFVPAGGRRGRNGDERRRRAVELRRPLPRPCRAPPRTARHGRAPPRTARHGRATRRPPRPSPAPPSPRPTTAAPRAALARPSRAPRRPPGASPRRPRRVPPRPSQGRTAERRPTTPRALASRA